MLFTGSLSMMNGILTTLIVMSPLNMGQMLQEIRNWKSEQNRKPEIEMLNNAIDDFWKDGKDDTTNSEELLQLQSD
tara:strand:- start:338 stop:565 length:228 start_codon:yes stop_codon:yes gene_type:complete